MIQDKIVSSSIMIKLSNVIVSIATTLMVLYSTNKTLPTNNSSSVTNFPNDFDCKAFINSIQK